MYNPDSIQVSPDTDIVVADFRELALLAAARPEPLRLAFEAIAFGTHIHLFVELR
jgi:hypothetical protein